ncbi:MAG: hypothetical protein JXA09_06600, partial [Anaerolineae bacterium]|nr:hypothetical protein [Anaerolineae bacterium]
MRLPRPPTVIRNRYFLAGDVALTAMAALLGFAIRLDVPALWSYLPVCVRFIALALAIKIPLYYLFGLYRRYWRYASVPEMLLVLAATTVSSGVLALAVFIGLFLPRAGFAGFPRSALIIDWLLSVVCVGGIRFSVRYLGEFGPLK